MQKINQKSQNTQHSVVTTDWKIWTYMILYAILSILLLFSVTSQCPSWSKLLF